MHDPCRYVRFNTQHADCLSPDLLSTGGIATFGLEAHKSWECISHMVSLKQPTSGSLERHSIQIALESQKLPCVTTDVNKSD